MLLVPIGFNHAITSTVGYPTAWTYARTAESVARTNAPVWGDAGQGVLANASDGSDSTVACCLLYNGGSATPAYSSQILRMTNAQFNVTGTVKGVRTRFRRKVFSNLNSAKSHSVKIRKADGSLSNELVSSPGDWTNELIWEIWGSASALNGLALSAADVNATGFGVEIIVKGLDGSGLGYISQVELEITYENQ